MNTTELRRSYLLITVFCVSVFASVRRYGSHPFLLQVLNSGAAHGLFVRSSNGMDVVLSQRAAQFRLIGGVLEWYLFMGPTPEQVTQQYHGLIGRPALPPFWSLGFHQCKWGYKNIGELQQVVEAYAANQIPLDTITSDIDHMVRSAADTTLRKCSLRSCSQN
jgi:alpha-glucosidase (family GH31 glycosyl hydrolase)